MKIACINYQPVSLYRDQGWSTERLDNYYNPTGVADDCLVLAFQEKEPITLSLSVKVEGFESRADIDRKLGMFRPDVLRCYEANYPFCLMALDVVKDLGIPSYLSLHDSRKHYDRKLSGYTVITAYSETVARTAKARLGREIEVQFNGVDSELFDPDPEWTLAYDVEETFKKHKINYENFDFVVYTIGRVGDPLHNMENLVAAMDLFRKKSGRRACLIVSGFGFGPESFDEDWIFPIGKTKETEIRDILSISDCFLQVRTMPEICMAQTEAMMMGVSLIAAGSHETDRIINWPFGLTLRNIYDYESIADHLLFLSFNMETARAASQERRRRAVERFDMDRLREREAERYRRLFKKSIEWRQDTAKQEERIYHGN